MELQTLLASIDQGLKSLAEREQEGEDVTAEREELVRELKNARRGSRFAAEDSPNDVLDALASGGSIASRPDRDGKSARGGSVPAGWKRGLALGMKALAEGTGSAGGFLVPIEIAEDILTIARSRSAVMRLGPRVVSVRKELDLTSMSAGATASYVAENALIPVSEETFAQGVLLKPKELAALVPVSNRLLRDAADSPDVEQVVRSDLAEVLALAQDFAFVMGTGGLSPLGIRTQPGTTAAPNLGANGRAPTFDDLKAMVAGVRAANAPFLRPGWVFNPRLLTTLEQLKDSTGRYLLEAGLLEFDATGGGGKLLNFPFATTGQIPTNLARGTSNDATFIIFSSDWEEFWVGEEQGLEVDLSGEAAYSTDGGTTWHSSFQERQTLFRATMTHDAAPRRPAWFTVMEGVRP